MKQQFDWLYVLHIAVLIVVTFLLWYSKIDPIAYTISILYILTINAFYKVMKWMNS